MSESHESTDMGGKGNLKRKRTIDFTQKRETAAQRAVTCTKRRAGLFSKAAELCQLSDDVQMAILTTIPSNKDKFIVFGHPSVNHVVDRVLGSGSGSGSGIVLAGTKRKRKREATRYWWEQEEFDNLTLAVESMETLRSSALKRFAFLQSKEPLDRPSTTFENPFHNLHGAIRQDQNQDSSEFEPFTVEDLLRLASHLEQGDTNNDDEALGSNDDWFEDIFNNPLQHLHSAAIGRDQNQDQIHLQDLPSSEFQPFTVEDLLHLANDDLPQDDTNNGDEALGSSNDDWFEDILDNPLQHLHSAANGQDQNPALHQDPANLKHDLRLDQWAPESQLLTAQELIPLADPQKDPPADADADADTDTNTINGSEVVGNSNSGDWHIDLLQNEAGGFDDAYKADVGKKCENDNWISNFIKTHDISIGFKELNQVLISGH